MDEKNQNQNDSFYGNPDAIQKVENAYYHANRAVQMIAPIVKSVYLAIDKEQSSVNLFDQDGQEYRLKDKLRQDQEKYGYPFKSVERFYTVVSASPSEKKLKQAGDKLNEQLVPGSDILFLLNVLVRSEKERQQDGIYALSYVANDQATTVGKGVTAAEVQEVLDFNNIGFEGVSIEGNKLEMKFTSLQMQSLEHRAELWLEALEHKNMDPFVYLYQQNGNIDAQIRQADQERQAYVTAFMADFNALYNEDCADTDNGPSAAHIGRPKGGFVTSWRDKTTTQEPEEDIVYVKELDIF